MGVGELSLTAIRHLVPIIRLYAERFHLFLQRYRDLSLQDPALY